jgi:hypothetical protein
VQTKRLQADKKILSEWKSSDRLNDADEFINSDLVGWRVIRAMRTCLQQLTSCSEIHQVVDEECISAHLKAALILNIRKINFPSTQNGRKNNDMELLSTRGSREFLVTLLSQLGEGAL